MAKRVKKPYVLTQSDTDLLKHVLVTREHDRGLVPPETGYLPGMALSTEERAKVVRQAHRLVREGYLVRTQYSEQVRGEKRFYWWVFTVTDKAVAIIRAANGLAPIANYYKKLNG